ncbi:hypothetical protein [Burkholderia alba]|uniref:hypothetical protein n=1 Tax=Burkholderia alba TaxID=2683677 RepID=UPI002B061C0B|nr:hypothetical protein [Burkholderia alba]
MTRFIIAALVAAALAGCSSDPRAARRGTPPQDPADYHGVPTDMTPPAMVGEPAAPSAASAPAQ